MAQIDVSELMADPDFVDAAAIIRRKPTVDAFGQNQLTETCFPTVASVQPISGRTLQRIPESLRVANQSSFWVRGEIIASSSTGARYPDLISFKGKRYQVQMVFDWTNWGSGWSEGICVAEKPSG